jgi:two-component system response regulator DegU
MEGRSNADIARHQGIAEITVKNHLAAIFNKLSVSNRSEAVAVAMKKHLLE